LQPGCHEQWRKGRHQTSENLAPPLSALDAFPGLRVTQLEQMRMTPAHLRFELLDHARRSELLTLLAEHKLEGEMQQQIAELSADLVDVALAQCLVQLEGFLYEIGSKCFPGLGPVPGASLSEVPNHFHRAFENRIVLHRTSPTNIIPPAHP
jgi:hypothetical protein